MKQKGLCPVLLYVIRFPFIERQQIGRAVSAAQNVQFTISTHARLFGRHLRQAGITLFVVASQIEKITLLRSHFDGGRHSSENESEELEIDVTTVARNDSRV